MGAGASVALSQDEAVMGTFSRAEEDCVMILGTKVGYIESLSMNSVVLVGRAFLK